MKLHEIKPKQGATKARKRVGRGNASGHGTYTGRGMKGAGQRKSPYNTPGFEGGQTSIISRLPKLKGFKNPNKVRYQVVNVGDLKDFKESEEVNVESLVKHGLIAKKTQPVKLLADGNISKKLTVKVHKVSKAARDKIVKAGGKIV